MLAAVLSAVDDAASRIVVGPRQPVTAGVLIVREEPPGGGPVAALRAGLAEVSTEVTALLAGDLPFLTTALIGQLRAELDGDGVLVVDDGGRDQWLLGVWRTAALRSAVSGAHGPTSLRKVLAPLSPRRLRPTVDAGQPPPWLDCDTPADLARARAAAGAPEHAPQAREPTPEPVPPPVQPSQPSSQPSVWPLFRSPGEG